MGGLLSALGAAAGGIGGFMLGGPIGALAGAGIGLGLGGSFEPGPKTASYPPPSNSIVYGDDGEILSSTVWDSKSNSYITKGRYQEPQKPRDGASQDEIDKYNADHAKWAADKAQRDADKQKLSDLRTKMLDNLNTTPEDRVKAYAEYQQAFDDAAHRDLDPRFAEVSRTADEQANATGMYGSRAYVDTKAALARDKMNQDTDIANQAIMAKEQLANTDRNYWSNMLNQIDNGSRADTLAASQVANGAASTANQQYSGILAQTQAQNNDVLTKWKGDQARNASIANAGTNLAGGLMYLYGGKTGTTTPKSAGTTTRIPGTNGLNNAIYN